jgi:hypothetical protein
MKSLLAFGVLFFALSFCGLTDRITKQINESTETSDSTTKPDGDTDKTTSDDGGGVEKATLSPAQESILDGGSDAKWDDQGISFTVPGGWNKMDVKKTSFNYGSPKTGFLIGSISVMPASFPSDTSLNAMHTQALEQLKNGKYENVRWLEIDGIKGVETVEAMPEEKSSPRRHQWQGYRTYLGQNQMVNIIISTSGDKFDSKKDTFAAILYSMKMTK